MQKLAARFVPAADDDNRLAGSAEEDGRLYRKFADQGHYGGRGQGFQGVYFATPSGILLASEWCRRDPARVAAMMEKALAKWETLSRQERLLPENPVPGAAERWRRWEKQYPRDGLVLRVVCRDLPRDDIPPVFQDRWNQDYAWFRKEEARQFLPATIKKGARHDVPRGLVERLARFHLIDHVRAHTYHSFPQASVQAARLTATMTDVQGDRVSLRFEGATRTSQAGTSAANTARGYAPALRGRATYDRRKQRFLAFELLAVGDRWGAAESNMRIGGPSNHRDLGPAPMGVLLTLAGRRPVDQLPPAFIAQYGWR